MPDIEFLFDFISPYSYLAWTQVGALARRHGRDLKPIPVLLAAMLNANNSKGPAEIPNKRNYLIKDCMRTAKLLGVPIGVPPSHPFNPLLALRVAAGFDGDANQLRVIDALFAAVWAGGGGVTDPARVAAILDGLGLDGAEAVKRASADAIKARVKESTERAIARGAFGVPTVFVDGELFWGFDAFPHLERFLRGEEQLDPELIERWRVLPASASRA